jgi:hypothetical protein
MHPSPGLHLDCPWAAPGLPCPAHSQLQAAPAPSAAPRPFPRLTIQTGTPNLSALFSLQNVTPIHIAPAVWLGLHWRGLRGEAVLAGMVSGLAVTVGLVFSPYNVGLAKGLDSTASGLSTAMIGFFVNFAVTVALGLALKYYPNLFGNALAAARRAAAIEHLDIGAKRDKMLKPLPWALMFLLLLFTAPLCFRPGARNKFIGSMAVWPFISLLFSGVLAFIAAYAYLFLWEVRPLLGQRGQRGAARGSAGQDGAGRAGQGRAGGGGAEWGMAARGGQQHRSTSAVRVGRRAQLA